MMTPKFIDVVEFVRGGEKDPEMVALLKQHPDGRELLKQARFINTMLKYKMKELDPPGKAEGIETHVASLEAESAPRSMRAFYQKSVAEMSLSPGARLYLMEDLGSLNFMREGELVKLSYKPSKAAMAYFGKPRIKFEMAQSDIEGIEIRGASIGILLPEAVTTGDLLPLRLFHRARQRPAACRKIVFMPESGKFVRYEADKSGRIQLLLPEVSGTLRIDAPMTQILHLRLKK